MINALESSSTRPYLIRALYEWCTDNGLTPYVAVQVDESVQVPREYVKNGEIVLNLGLEATSSLKLGNEYIEFKARFAGTAREINVPIGRVLAIYARESGQGMSFPMSAPSTAPEALLSVVDASEARVPAHSDAARADGGATAKTMRLVTGDAVVDDKVADAPTNLDEPPRPPGGGKKPALKRIK